MEAEKEKDGQQAQSKAKSEAQNFEAVTGVRGEPADASRPDIMTQCQPKEEAAFVEGNRSNHAFSQSTGNTLPAPCDELQRRVQQQIDDINSKRKRDTDILSDFKKALEMQVTKTCGVIEEAIVSSYEEHSRVIEEKLQEIFAALERIRQLETELGNFKEILGMLYTDMQSV